MFMEAASGTLAEAEAGLAPAFNGSDMEPSRAHDAAGPPKEISLSSSDDASFIGVRVLGLPGSQELLLFRMFMS